MHTSSSACCLHKSASHGNLAHYQQQHCSSPAAPRLSRLRHDGMPRAASHCSLSQLDSHAGAGATSSALHLQHESPLQHRLVTGTRSSPGYARHEQQQQGANAHATTSFHHHQQQLRVTPELSAPASTSTRVAGASAAAAAASPFASLTRVLLIGQPSNLVRTLAGRKWRASGPVSLLVFLFGLIVAILTAVRAVLVRRVKACKCCRGYGIVRCRLCNGEGAVEWRGKNNHQEMCPLCMTKRFVTCPDCGGHYHKKTFIHVTGPQGRGPVPEFLS